MSKPLGCGCGCLTLLIATAAVAIGMGLIIERRPLAIGGAVLTYGVILYVAACMAGTQKRSWRDGRASWRQKSFADELGIQYPRNITKGELSDLIDARLEGRRHHR